MTDYVQEQEMEIEALEAILMEDFEEIDPSESGINTTNRCFQITISPLEDDVDESTTTPGSPVWLVEFGGFCFIYLQMALIFSHTERYPDEPPLLHVRSLRGIQTEDLKTLKQNLEQEASENLGMAMVYTLVSSAKEWLGERYRQDIELEDDEEEDIAKDEIIIPHGEPVTLDTFIAWRERFEAELALERAKLMPESALATTKEKKIKGREWFESGRAVAKGATAVAEGSEDEDDEDIELDDEDFEDDEEDMLEHYLAEKGAA